MLNPWMKVLPLWVITWLAERHCERFDIQGGTWALAFKDVLVRVKE